MTKINVKPKFNQPLLGSSSEVALGDLDVFSSIPTQSDIQGDVWDKIYPVNGSLLPTNPGSCS